MKQFKLVGLLILMVTLFQSCKEGSNAEINMNGDWKFKLIEDDAISDNEMFATNFNDASWETVGLPHTAHIEPVLVNDQWQGICWYRKTVKIPKADANKKIFFELEAAMNFSKIWINGLEVSAHHGGYLPVIVDITNYVKFGEDNSIAIRLDNKDNVITGPKPLKRLDFNMYGGLYRNASIYVKDKVHISNPILAKKVAGGGVFITYPKVSEEETIVHVKTNIVNEEKSEQTVEVVQKVFFNNQLEKEVISEKVTIEAGNNIDLNESISIENAQLWSPNTPNLYRLETTVLLGGKIIDTQTTRFGIREFVFENNELYVNGEKTFLRGVNRHQEYPFIGYALSDNAQYRDAKKIKEAGFNYIRLSHYPQSPAFMNACDELGLVVVDAIMGWQFYSDTDSFREYCYRSASELIRRDRNHPCVLAWEVSLNETQMPVFFMEELNRIVHAEFPGENVYSCGWMDDVYDIYLQARQHRILHPHELKDKPYSVSEYGDWEYYSKNAGLNQDKLANNLRDEYSSRQARAYGEERLLRQAFNVQESHNDNLNTAAFSDSYWVMYDYNRGYHDDIEKSGLMDIFRIEKPAYQFYKSQKDPSEDVVLNIATYWNAQSPKNVKVYSNCDEVKLYLNDALIASQKPDIDSISTNLKHPPFTFNINEFEAGTLKAVGSIKGQAVAETYVTTPEKATKLKIWLDESGKAPQSGVNDVLFLYIAAIDENGTINPDFAEEIDLNLEGDVEVMNVENITAEAGIATALIRIGKSKGNIKVSGKSEDLVGDYNFEVN
ncbi:glycoside hydrolase family 2 protein [Formosa sp. PL04]|uniref:glycoside hydrolase family 2 protein n=1 Tax=Formosa sp. PL04 TaxID=3081755 RepID=UPI0029810105|nr:glycoside hydrolase family 2 TIM barrel-domain containing protein [Formosa sp. PL04]MDW5288089.1 glycoside hydrolase family 2 TIM barrel-domain containing protein [Formosa sp. PL04]